MHSAVAQPDLGTLKQADFNDAAPTKYALSQSMDRSASHRNELAHLALLG